jgi:hypothetical protein
MFNFSTRRVGGLRFFKIGRINISISVSSEYRPLANPDRLNVSRSLGMLAAFYGLFMAIALLIVPTVAHASEQTYSLVSFQQGQMFVLDSHLTRQDCASELTGNLVCLPETPFSKGECNGDACND